MSVVLTRPTQVQLVRPQAQRILPSNYGKHGFDNRIEESQLANASTQALTENAAEIVNSVLPTAEMVHHVIPPDSPSPPEEHEISHPKVLERPVQNIIRPIALKVARPIPKAAVEEFYDETYRHGMHAEHVHEATVLAQDWHRKWTQQDEQGHTMPEPEPDVDPFSNASGMRNLQTDPRFDPLDRFSGAKNPSPGESREDPYCERKRLRISASGSISSLSPGSGEDNEEQLASDNAQSTYEPPQARRRVVGFDACNQVSPVLEPGCGGLIKPQALRVQRPQAIDITTAMDILANTQNFIDDVVPADIQELRSQHISLSPLTLPSVSSSYRRPKPANVEEESSPTKCIPSEISHVSKRRARRHSPEIDAARNGVLHRLAVAGGDVVEDAEFHQHLDTLKEHFQSAGVDTRYATDEDSTSEGMWLTLTSPTFFGNLGTNDDGDPMYTLGRMSFDMFSPTRLVCSLQGNFNSVETVPDDQRSAMLDAVPKALQEEVASGKTILRTYNIITAMTIEPNLAAWPEAPNKDVRRPIRGIMTTTGYTLPDPENPNRNSVWITGGRIEPNDDPVDQQEWKRQFGKNPPKHGLAEHAKLLAVKLLMGATIPSHMDEDGTMEYTFQRPLGGHGLAYVDTLYLDDTLRIVQGHRGTIFVFYKLPEGKTIQ